MSFMAVCGIMLVSYLGIGAGIGIWWVFTHLAYYFSAGFHYRWMAWTVFGSMFLWPVFMIGELRKVKQ